MISHGMPPRPDDTERRVRELERQVAQMQGSLVQATNAANAWQGRVVGLQDGVNGPGLTGSWTPYLINTITVPDGFTGAVVTVCCSTGITFTSGGGSYGYVGAQPAITGTSGPAISNGVIIPSAGGTTACSVTSTFTAVISVTPGGTFQVAAGAYASGTAAIVSGSDNVHLSASVIFTR